ncbi:putative ATPase/DNA-binding SARP family transcriptional activator [Kibdelosporangium banguiense]|uniref:ATPase/DNA-binding SARP family transcriptional activator n=1 Tax=Kibdelosporangium banguiense TaxID=1365924 RepID=A0ABS4T9E3_9PSEU|nr:BTAD domain-containing putative transcriptional regulator [Kibdelosporangium banguiense]MBP2321046.1 putative ATPase/DNA-binding SARP family transcriptional activator [Kibdelosporangium banguiense]
MRFGVLGPLAVWTADGREVRVPEVKVRTLLADLLVQEGRPVPADRLADDLWGDRLPGNPVNTLQTKVSQLRKALEEAEPGGRLLVSLQAGGYVMQVDVDVAQFRELTARASTSEDARTRATLLSDALALWRGPALADFADEAFAVPVIQRLAEERLAAQEEFADARLDLGEHGSLAGELTELVSTHPYRERLRALQMRALYRAGRQSEALDSFRQLQTLLDDELGLTPGPELVALQQAILSQDPALGPPALSGTNLPEPLTELVGRDIAVQSVLSLIGETRLVTLTGPGGVGKTRLAIQTARQLPNAWLIEFSGLDQHGTEETCPRDDLVAEVMATTLGVRDEGGSGVDRLAQSLHAREVLLVLDNCEGLVESIAKVAVRLLQAVPRLRILATSQEPLGVAGEVVWNVPPLDVPGAASVAAEDVQAFSAVQLFVARASAAAPGFALDATNSAAVAAICRRLDGIPLALELAATRVRALGPHELLRRLDDRFRLLASGNRSGPARQRTLRAMIDWSWQLLSAEEQVVLRRLAVHAEGASLAAVEALCAGGNVHAEDVLNLLANLVDRSLVVNAHGPRYRLLESVVVYCLDRLRDADELEEMRRRHAEYYMTLAERIDSFSRTREQRAWLDLIDLEAPNFRRAMETALQLSDAELAFRLVNALTWCWFLRGRINEARIWIRQALALAGDQSDLRTAAQAWEAGLAVLAGEVVDLEGFAAAYDIKDPGSRAMALWFLGYVTTTMGGTQSTEVLTTQALAEFEKLDDRWGIAVSLVDRVTHHKARGDFDAAECDAERAAKLIDDIGERWAQLQASFTVGTLAEISGDYTRATRIHHDALRMAEELDLAPEISYQLSWLGRIAILTGDHDKAWDLHSRARRIGADQGFKPAEMYAEIGLALGARQAGLLDLAEKHLLNVLDWHRDQGFESGSALILAELGFIAELRGDLPTALRLHLNGYAIARDTGDPRAVALALEGLAGTQALARNFTSAARLLGAAAQARESVGRPLPQGQRSDVNRITETTTETLGPEIFTTEFTLGTRTPPDTLIPTSEPALWSERPGWMPVGDSLGK